MKTLIIFLVISLLIWACARRMFPDSYEYRPARLIESNRTTEWSFVNDGHDSVVSQTWEFLDNHFTIQFTVPIWLQESNTKVGTIKCQNRRR